MLSSKRGQKQQRLTPADPFINKWAAGASGKRPNLSTKGEKMVSNNCVKFLVDEEQLVRLKQNATLKGHKTLSSYLREVALNKDDRFVQMIWEIHNQVVKNGKTADTES